MTVHHELRTARAARRGDDEGSVGQADPACISPRARIGQGLAIPDLHRRDICGCLNRRIVLALYYDQGGASLADDLGISGYGVGGVEQEQWNASDET